MIIKNNNDNHKPWLPKLLTKKCEDVIKSTTDITMAFLISPVCEAPIKIPSN